MSSKCPSKDFTFGVELEYNLYDEGPREKLRPSLGRGWVVKPEHCGTEIVSPILRGSRGILECRRNIISILASLYSAGFKEVGMNDCGLHVHVGIDNTFTLGNLKRLLILVTRFENAIFHIMAERRKGNNFSHPLRLSEEEILKATTFKSLEEKQNARHGRYYGCNIVAFRKHGTIEFRYSASTISWPVIYSLISLYVRMVYFAKGKDPIPVGIRENPVENLKLLLTTIGAGSIASKNLLNLANDSDKKEKVFGKTKIKLPRMKGLLK